MSGGVFRGLPRVRSPIAAASEWLMHGRALQSTFRSIFGATRFKFVDNGALLPAVCRYCGRVDSYRHLAFFAIIGPRPESRVQLNDYLVKLSGWV